MDLEVQERNKSTLNTDINTVEIRQVYVKYIPKKVFMCLEFFLVFVEQRLQSCLYFFIMGFLARDEHKKR